MLNRMENSRQHSIVSRPGTAAGVYFKGVLSQQQTSVNTHSNRLLKLIESKLEEVTVKLHCKKK